MQGLIPDGYLRFEGNWKITWEGREKGLPCWLSQFSKTSSETYPYPKGKHNGAKGPKYASSENDN